MAVLTINRGVKAHAYGAVMDADLSGAAPAATSDVWELYEIAGMMVQAISTGADLEAALTLECSNVEGGAGPFDPVADVSFAAITEPGSQSVDVGNARARYYRISAERTAGTGHVAVYVHAKGGST
jgi:hypothetical protein